VKSMRENGYLRRPGYLQTLTQKASPYRSD